MVIRSLLERYAHFAAAPAPASDAAKTYAAESQLDSQSAARIQLMELLPANSSLKSSPIAVDLNLTQREQQVLNLLTDGLSNSQIGESLHLSPSYY